MKIFVVGTRGFPGIQGGIERHCEQLYPLLKKYGFDITVATRTPYINSNKKNMDTCQGIKFVNIWAPRQQYFEAISHTFIGILKARFLSIKTIHIHAIGPALMSPFARLLGLRIVVTHHGPDYNRKKWNFMGRFVLRIGEYMALIFAHKIIAVSKGIKKMLLQKRPKSNVKYIPNGVSSTKETHTDVYLDDYGIKRHGYVLTVGRFVPEKGFHDLLETFKHLSAERFKLVIVGDADHETGYSRSLKQMANLMSNVVLTGKLNSSKLAVLYKNAGLYVMPSYYEGLPISVLEALCYNTPVLVSDIAPHRELPISRSRLFKPGEIDILRIRITEKFDVPYKPDELNRINTTLACEYCWEEVAKRTARVFESLMLPVYNVHC